MPLSFPVGETSRHYRLSNGAEVILVRKPTGEVEAFSARSPGYGRRVRYIDDRLGQVPHLYDGDAKYDLDGIRFFGGWANLDRFEVSRQSPDRFLIEDARWVYYGWCATDLPWGWNPPYCSEKASGTKKAVLRRHRAEPAQATRTTEFGDSLHSPILSP